MSALYHDLAIIEDGVGTVDIVTEVRREAALLKTGALQNAILNSANFSSIATDEKGVIQLFNVGAERMLGYAAIEVVDKITPADISDPQEVIARAKALSHELATPITPGFEALVFKASRGIEDIYELTYIRKDGTRFPAVVSVTALRGDHGGIIGYLLIGTDNTARKQAEEELIKAGALQNAIFCSENFSSIATDEKGVIQLFNVGAERMLGYAAIEVVDKITPADISDPQEVIARARALSHELATTITPGFDALAFKASRGIEDIYELTYIRKDGSRFPAVVSVTALRDPQGGIIGYLLIGTDNTARKQVEAEQQLLDQRLRDQQFYTRSLIESNIDALMTTDPRGIITDVNQQMGALTGCTRDELIGAPFKNYFTDPEWAEAGIKRVLRESKVTDYELTARARDGKETVVSYNLTTFHDRDRKLQGVFAAARDVTERKRFEQTQQENNVELERANQDLQHFAYAASHDLQEPLRMVTSYTQLLARQYKGKLDQQADQFIAYAVEGAQRMEMLLKGLRDYWAVNEEKVEQTVLVDCNLVLEKALAYFELPIQETSAVVTHDLLPTVIAEELPLVLVFKNLIGNALKYNQSAETVRIHVSARQNARVSIVSVRDNGIGIEPEYLGKIFAPFKRLHGSEYPGSGLGLAICQRVVERYGGRIWVESIYGQGSTFHFTIPAEGGEV
jgi:PAS domain S-box-containing protein